MRQENLPSPGAINNGQTLRREAAKAISYHEIQLDRRGEPAAAAVELRDFFLACADAVAVPTEPAA